MTLCDRTGKEQYSSRVAVKRASAHLKGCVRIYECGTCRTWHFTSKPTAVERAGVAYARQRSDTA